MFEPIHHKTATLLKTNLISLAPAGRGLFFITLAFVCLGLLPPKVFGVTPPPDGGYPNRNTAEGTQALNSLTTGTDNTAIGFNALFSLTEGIFNTAIGAYALNSLTTGQENTAIGFGALVSNTTGQGNTASGDSALVFNTTGGENTANGWDALYRNTTGSFNTATGGFALSSNTTGDSNTANGDSALLNNTTGNFNTANGSDALLYNTTGNFNTANGSAALFYNFAGNYNTATGVNALFGCSECFGFSLQAKNNTATGAFALVSNGGNNNTAEGFQALAANTTGNNNIALGYRAGRNLTTGSNNIDIGAPGIADESNKIRIGKQGTHDGTFIAGISGVPVNGTTVVVNASGKLGVAASSARFKEAIKPMDKASEAILSLKPVTFHYKQEIDPGGTPQFGLVAEQVEKVNPDLVARDEKGRVYTVRYDAVNAMLLNEFLKEHRKTEQQETTITQLKSTMEQQQKVMEVLAATLKEQAAQIQKVSAQVKLSKSATKVVDANR